MIEKWVPDLLTLSTTFYDVSVLCNRLLKAQKAQIWPGGNAGVKLVDKESSTIILDGTLERGTDDDREIRRSFGVWQTARSFTKLFREIIDYEL